MTARLQTHLVSPQKRQATDKKIKRLLKAKVKAEEDFNIAVHQAHEDGLPWAEIARMAGGMHPTSMAHLARRGEKALTERRRRGGAAA